MKKESEILINLNEKEVKNISGGYHEPTPEQLEQLREKYGPWTEFVVCW